MHDPGLAIVYHILVLGLVALLVMEALLLVPLLACAAAMARFPF